MKRIKNIEIAPKTKKQIESKFSWYIMLYPGLINIKNLGSLKPLKIQTHV